MQFFFVALIFMYLGRKIGWLISRAILYRSPTIIAILVCIAWGLAIALVIQELIRLLQPVLLLKAIMGYGLGLYLAIPNFGLVNESTIPPNARPRHTLISGFPAIVYIAASLAAMILY